MAADPVAANARRCSAASASPVLFRCLRRASARRAPRRRRPAPFMQRCASAVPGTAMRSERVDQRRVRIRRRRRRRRRRSRRRGDPSALRHGRRRSKQRRRGGRARFLKRCAAATLRDLGEKEPLAERRRAVDVLGVFHACRRRGGGWRRRAEARAPGLPLPSARGRSRRRRFARRPGAWFVGPDRLVRPGDEGRPDPLAWRRGWPWCLRERLCSFLRSEGRGARRLGARRDLANDAKLSPSGSPQRWLRDAPKHATSGAGYAARARAPRQPGGAGAAPAAPSRREGRLLRSRAQHFYAHRRAAESAPASRPRSC